MWIRNAWNKSTKSCRQSITQTDMPTHLGCTSPWNSFPVLSHLSTSYPICSGKLDGTPEDFLCISGCIGGAGILSRGIIACQHSLQHPQSTVGQSHLSGDISHIAQEDCHSEGGQMETAVC